MEAAGKALADLGVPPDRVHLERFQAVEGDPVEDGVTGTAEVTLDGVTHRLPWPATARLLDVIIDAGLNPPYSCRQGICGACACQLTSGKVEMAHNEVLEEGDLAEGYILACQALAQTPGVSITY